MSEDRGSSDRKLNGLLWVTLLVAILVVVSVARSMLGFIFASPAEASIQLVEEKLATPPSSRVQRTVRKQAWQPQYAVPRAPAREKAGTNEPAKTFKVHPIPPSIAAELREKQMAYLRADLVENADDDTEDMPTLEDIATMEKNGVMVW